MKRSLIKIFLLAALAGAAAAFSPGGVFVLVLLAVTCMALHRWVRPPDRGFVIRLFLVGFVIRAVLSLGLDLGSYLKEGCAPSRRAPPEYWNLGIVDKTRNYIRMGDSDYYSQRGYCLSEFVKGNSEAVVLRRIQEYGYNSYVLLIGWFYYLFGFSPISVKLFNCWIGSLHLVALFFLARSCFQPTIARWASGLAFLFPTLVLWSASNLKEPFLFLLITLFFLLFRTAQKERPLRSRVLCAGVLTAMYFILFSAGRQEFFLAMAGCLLLVCWAQWCLRKRWYAALLLTAAAFFLPAAQAKTGEAIYYAVYRHMGYVQGGGMVYRYLPDPMYIKPGSMEWTPFTESTLPMVVLRSPVAVLQFLLQPVPARTGEWFTVLLAPQMLVWYFLLPLALIGMGAAVWWNSRGSVFLVVTVSAWILMSALSNANIGTTIRIRDMMTPILLIFSAAGLWALARGRAGFSGEVIS